jgi:hypothetical protein
LIESPWCKECIEEDRKEKGRPNVFLPHQLLLYVSDHGQFHKETKEQLAKYNALKKECVKENLLSVYPKVLVNIIMKFY